VISGCDSYLEECAFRGRSGNKEDIYIVQVRLTALRECLGRQLLQLLIEGRVEDARAKYPNVSDVDFNSLVQGQPSGTSNKYLMWSCKRVDAGETVETVVAAVRLFDGNRQRLEKKDLNQYKTATEVNDAVTALPTSKGELRHQIRADTDIIHNDDRFLVLRPHTEKAACKYGTGTKWCIAATAGRNYFGSYSESNNKFYYVIDKKAKNEKTPTSKFAIAIVDAPRGPGADRVQVYNSRDKHVNISVVAAHVGPTWPQIWAKITSHVTASPTTRDVNEARKKLKEHSHAPFRRVN
jgi:hypothetical protein